MLNTHFHTRLFKRKSHGSAAPAPAPAQTTTAPAPRLKDWWRGAGYQQIEQKLQTFNPVSRLLWRISWSLTALMVFLSASISATYAQTDTSGTGDGLADIQKAADALAGDIQKITLIVIFVCLLMGGFLLLIGGINVKWMQMGIRIIGGVVVGSAFIFIIAKPASSFIKGFNTNTGNTTGGGATTGMIMSLFGF